MAEPESWNEFALVTISDGTTDMQIAAMIESIDISGGDKPYEGIPTLSGGRIGKLSPEEDTEITFEGYVVGIGDKDATSQTGLDLLFHEGSDSTAPFEVDSSSLDRSSYTVVILWTDGTETTARASIPSGTYARRHKYENAYMTSCTLNMSTTEPAKGTWKFKVTPRNKSGTANITKQYADGTASLASA